ncbi:MAG TPA: hypothetical protein VGE59_03450 [Patescibacteria group bacterium]
MVATEGHMAIESGTDFLKQKYDLHNKPEVQSAAERTEHHVDGQLPQNPSERIQNYLDRFSELTNRDEPEKRQRGLEALKRVLHDKFVIKSDEIPESYWETQRRMAREMGHGDIEVSEEMRRQGTEIIIADQESSLDKWVDYLASDDAIYPMWLKYFAVRGVLGMSTYDKERHAFAKRDKGTTAPFPDLDREALAYVLDALEKRQGSEYAEVTEQLKQKKNELKRLRGEYRTLEKQGLEAEASEITLKIEETEAQISNLVQEQERIVSGSLAIPEESRSELRSLLQESDFAKLYVWALEKVTPAEENELLITDGEWVKYEQGSDATPLVESLQGHGTGWCTAGESTARAQLEAGDFYVYYTYSRDELLNKRQGQPAVAHVPRAAIRMEQDRIGEVRGIAAEQNLDPHIADVVRAKMQEFPDGASYEKKAYDMQMLTYIEKKTKAGHELNKDDLVFLYEINSTIEGFGYDRDPRIAELRAERNPDQDAPIVFDCQPEDIAHSFEDITQDTKAYIGPLVPGIFTILPENLEHIYTSFPENKIRQRTIEIGGKSGAELEQDLKTKGFKISDYARHMLRSQEFVPAERPEPANLVIATVASIGFPRGATTAQIYAKAEELGLEICPAEVGPHFRLQYPEHEQPMNEWNYVAMKTIAVPGGRPGLFRVERREDGAWLSSSWDDPDGQWSAGSRFVFRRK